MTPAEAIAADNAALMAKLSPREAEVLALMTKGLNANEIGNALSMSAHTVNDHRRSIYRKLGVETACEAVAVSVSAWFAPAEAVAALQESRKNAAAEPKPKKVRGRLWHVGGERLTIAQMAVKAGCEPRTMYQRMQTMSAERAVSLGPPRPMHKRTEAERPRL